MEDELLRRGLVSVDDVVRSHLPKSVQACMSGTWHWRAVHARTGEVKLWRFHCQSWRHPGDCRNRCQQEKRERIEAALKPYPYDDVAFLVLTLDPKIWVKGSWLGKPETAYTTMKELWRPYAKWLRRNYGFAGYVNTVEAHASGMPHLNVLIVSKPLAADLRIRDSWRTLEALKGAARRSHFGRMSAESAADPQQLASYVTKVAMEINERTTQARRELASETTKHSQIPWMAPAGTRILRPSRGFLPKLEPKTSEYVTELVRRPAPKCAGRVVRIRWLQLVLELRPRRPVQLQLLAA